MREISIIVFVILLPVLLPIAIATADTTQAKGVVLAESGQKLYERYCSSCHGLSGKGDGPAADTLNPKPANLTGIARRAQSKADWGKVASFIDGRIAVAAHGSRKMPIWGKELGEKIPEQELREEMIRGDLAAIVDYLKSIQSK